MIIRPTSLASLHNEVHRFTGVLDRFGSCPTKTARAQTLCLRDLRLADTGVPVAPDHWWFQVREVWAEAGIRVGDTVLFTAKVQRATKGFHDPHQHHLGNPRRQAIGFASTPRSVVVLRRRQGHRHQLQQLEQELMQRELHLSEAIEEQERLARHYAALLERQQGLEKDLHHGQLCRHRLEQQLEQQLTESRHQRQRLCRRLALTAALTFSAGGFGGAALMAALQRPAPTTAPQASGVLSSSIRIHS